MAGGTKKRKREQEEPSGSRMSGVMKTLQVLTAQIQDLQALPSQVQDLTTQLQDQSAQIQDHKSQLKKLKPIHKKYVQEEGLFLVNEFLAFIDQIHGTGLQQKFDKAYVTRKFDKLGNDPKFTADCHAFVQSQGDSTMSVSDIVALFGNLCDERNRASFLELFSMDSVIPKVGG